MYYHPPLKLCYPCSADARRKDRTKVERDKEGELTKSIHPSIGYKPTSREPLINETHPPPLPTSTIYQPLSEDQALKKTRHRPRATHRQEEPSKVFNQSTKTQHSGQRRASTKTTLNWVQASTITARAVLDLTNSSEKSKRRVLLRTRTKH